MKKTLFLSAILATALCSSAFADSSAWGNNKNGITNIYCVRNDGDTVQTLQTLDGTVRSGTINVTNDKGADFEKTITEVKLSADQGISVINNPWGPTDHPPFKMLTIETLSVAGQGTAGAVTIQANEGVTISAVSGALSSVTNAGNLTLGNGGSSITLNERINNTGTLNINASGVNLAQITGTGAVTLSVASALTNAAKSIATGSLTVKGAQLNVGDGDGKEASISSFSSIILDGGIIRFQNKKDTFNNVSVALGKEGTITSFDMGPASDSALILAGETTVNGTLTLQNDWNAQFAVGKLLGSGTVNIKGVNDGQYDTNSREAATYVLGLDSFTGTINISNNKAAVKRSFATLDAISTATTNYTVTGGSITNVCTADFTGGSYTMGAVDGELSGNVSGGTLDGNGHLTLSGVISGGMIRNATYKNNDMSGGTFDNVTLAANERLNIHGGSVTLGDVTHATTGGSNNYAVVIWGNGSLTINGNANFTTNQYSKIGVDADCTLTVDAGGKLTSGDMLYSGNSNNGHLTVKGGGTMTINGAAKVKTITNAGITSISGTATMDSLSNSGTLTLKKESITISSVTLSAGSVTLGTDDDHNANLTTSALTVNGDAALNANLVVSNNGKMDFSAAIANGSTLTMGCSVTIGDNVTVVIDDSIVAGIVNRGETVAIITDVDAITSLENKTWHFQNAAGQSLDQYALRLEVGADGKSIVVAPEPATATLSLLALAGLCARRKRH